MDFNTSGQIPPNLILRNPDGSFKVPTTNKVRLETDILTAIAHPILNEPLIERQSNLNRTSTDPDRERRTPASCHFGVLF
jgi:hypothetical protein